MFSLRIIEETRKNENEAFEQVTTNHSLGNSYSILEKGKTSEFDDLMKKTYPEHDKSKLKGIICSDLGDDFFIEKNEENKIFQYFIMTENGKTFEKL